MNFGARLKAKQFSNALLIMAMLSGCAMVQERNPLYGKWEATGVTVAPTASGTIKQSAALFNTMIDQNNNPEQYIFKKGEMESSFSIMTVHVPTKYVLDLKNHKVILFQKMSAMGLTKEEKSTVTLGPENKTAVLNSKGFLIHLKKVSP